MYDYGLSTLEQYGLTAESTARTRGGLLCHTEKGLVIVKEFKGTEKKLQKQQELLLQIQSQGGKVDCYIQNQEENLVSRDRDGIPYTMHPVRLHLQNGGSWRHLALGVAGWMRYTQGVDEQGNAIDVVDPMLAEFQKINAQYQGADRVKALLGLSGIFADDLPQNADFVGAVTAAYQQLCERGARECVAAL